MATKVINDLVTKFSFAGPLAPLAKYNTLLGTSIGKLAIWTAAIAGATAVFDKWAHGVLLGIDSLDALSYQTRMSVGDIQRWNYMAKQNQSSASAMQSTLSNLANTIGSAAQKGSEDFARLGISVRDTHGHIKTADRILEEVGSRFKSLGLSIEEQRNFAGALGIDASLLRLLNRSSSELAELRAQAEAFGVLTDKQATQAAMYTRSVKALSFGLDSLRNLIAVGVGPQLERMVDGFAELLRNNRDWIVNGLQFAFGWLGRIWAMLKRVAPTIGVLTGAVVLLKIALLGVSTVLKGIGKIGVVLLITAIVLAIDDLIVAFKGGKSVIADFFQQEFGIDIVKELREAFAQFKAVAFAVWDWFEQNDGPARFSQVLTLLGDTVVTTWNLLKDFFGWLTHIGGELGTALAEIGFDKLLDQVSELYDSAKELGDVFAGWGESLGKDLFDFFHDAPELKLTVPEVVAPELKLTVPEVVAPELNLRDETLRPYPPTPAGVSSTVMNRYIDQRNTINVSASDPTRAAQLTYDSLDRQLDNANTQLAVGGM